MIWMHEKHASPNCATLHPEIVLLLWVKSVYICVWALSTP